MLEINNNINTVIIPVHFDVKDHYISLDTFLATADSVKNIVHHFNDLLFSCELEYQFVVLPPKEGSFLGSLAILCGAIASIAVFADTGLGKGVIRGFTGYEPEDFGEKIGKQIKLHAKKAAIIISEATKGFLQKDTTETEKIIKPIDFLGAYRAKNLFYESVSNNPTVNGLGFDESSYFSVERTGFADRCAKLPESIDKPETIDKQDYIDKIEKAFIEVTAPVWDRNDTKRQWVGKYDGQAVHFKMSDENFWQCIENKTLHPKIFDQYEVQWAIMPNGQKAKYEIRRVLKYNGETISAPLTESEISKILSDSKQSSLYNYPIKSYDYNDLPLFSVTKNSEK